MKMILRLIVFLFLLSGCSGFDPHSEHYTHVDFNTYYFLDTDTGVQYIIYSSSAGAAITPRLNADGTLYIKQ